MGTNMALTNLTLLVLKNLWENTDDEHTVSLADISAYLEANGLKRPDPRTLRSCIDQLSESGIDIITERKVQNRYHIGDRIFDIAEIKLMYDAVQSSKFITSDQSKRIINKLSSFVSPGQNTILNRQLYVDKRVKTDNESVLRHVDHIFTAIAKNKQIAFTYFDYSPEKKKIHRHDGRIYVVSPFDMIWNNDYYYFTAYDKHDERVKVFRADRVDDLRILDAAAEKRPADYRVDDYHSKVFSMYNGPECEVELECENELMNSIIDRFGENVQNEQIDSSHFRVRAKVALSSVFFGWIFASYGKMKLVGPASAVEQFNAILCRYCV